MQLSDSIMLYNFPTKILIDCERIVVYNFLQLEGLDEEEVALVVEEQAELKKQINPFGGLIDRQ